MQSDTPTTKTKGALLTIFLVVFIDLVGFGIVIPILPYYARQYGASATELGWLMAAYSAMQFLFAPFWGSLSDRYGRRPILLITIFGTALGMLMLGFARSLTALFVARLFSGFCAANISTAVAYIADVTTPENRAKGMGLVGAAFGLGFIFGPAIGGALSIYGFSTPMFVAASLSMVNLAFAIAKLKEPLGNKALRAANRAKRFDRKAIKEVFGDHRTRLATGTFFVVTLATTQLEVCFAIFMLARYGLGAREAGWLLAFVGIIMAIVQGGLIGKLSKRFGEQKLVIAGAVLMCAGLVTFAFSMKIALVFFSLGIWAVGNGLASPSLQSLASKGAQAERRGATMGVYQSAGSLARVIGPPIAGYTYDRYGIHTPFLIAGLLMIPVLVPNVFSLVLGGKSIVTWIREATKVFKESGFKGLVRTYGWKLMAFFFFYYLIRDVTLYILLPWMAAKGILGW